MAAETDPCGLRACRLLAMKSFPDADRRFGRRCCCPCSGLQMEMKQPQRVTQQRRKTERQIASSSCPLYQAQELGIRSMQHCS